MCFWECPKRGTPHRTSRHNRSIFCVCAPVSGSTKFWEWFTRWCTKPSKDRQSYARQQSDIILVPGRIHFLIRERRVAESRDGTGTRKDRPEPRSKPPKTQKPSTHRPLLYFRCPIFASSISTTTPSPPKTSDRCSIQNWQTSRQNELQSTTLFSLMDNSREMRVVRGCGKTSQSEQKRHITVWEKRCLSNHEWTRYHAPCERMFSSDLFTPPV